MSDPLAAIAELREVAARLERTGDPTLIRHAAALRSYEENAPTGRTLDDMLGLSQRGGAGSWWTQEARARRDEAIRKVREDFLAHLEDGDAADEIERLAARRRLARTQPANDKERLIDDALRAGKFPKRQRLRDLVSIPIGV